MPKVKKTVKKKTKKKTTRMCVEVTDMEPSLEWAQLEETMGRHYILHDTDYVHVVLGTMFANRLNDVPTWLYLAGQPSCGKTEILNPLAAHDSVKMISRWTEQTLVSGRGKQGSKADSSLLPELDKKVLIVKDLTSALSMNQNTAQSILGELRDAFDGKCSKAFGIKDGDADTVIKEYKSKFGMIAGVTHAIDKHHRIIGDLGERFLMYRIPDVPKDVARRVCMMIGGQHKESFRQEEMDTAACDVLNQETEAPVLSKEQLEQICNAAFLGATLRVQIPRDHRTKQAKDVPSTEAPYRIMKQLCNLAIGMSWAKGLPRVSGRDIDRAQKTALHGCTRIRRELLEYLMKEDWEDERTGVGHKGGGYRTAKQVSEGWVLFKEDQLRIMLEDLHLLGLADRYTYQTEKKKDGFKWRITHNESVRETLDALKTGTLGF